jgi:hypothetical protein
MLKIILINLAVLLVLGELAVFEYSRRYTSFPYKYIYKKSVGFDEQYARQWFRPMSEGQGKPIALFGCSVAYGFKIENEDSFGPKLSEYTGRPVYNRTAIGWGIQHMIYQLENEPLLNEMPEPEYVIYVFIADHARRLDFFVQDFWDIPSAQGPYLRYREKDGKLVRHEPWYGRVLFNSYLVKYFHVVANGNNPNTFWNKYRQNDGTYHGKYAQKLHESGRMDLLKLHIGTAAEKVREKWPNAKFVVLAYENTFRWGNAGELAPMFDELGIANFNANALSGINPLDREYMIPDATHPNAAAWDKVVPAFARELNL